MDLGRSSRFTQERWARLCKCRILRTDAFREGISDAQRVRDCLAAGRTHLVDKEGIDWWDVLFPLIEPRAVSVLVLARVVKELPARADFWISRPGELCRTLAVLLGCSIASFSDTRLKRSAARAMHCANAVRRFSAAQLRQIIFDKYDSGYRWRAHLSRRPIPARDPFVLIPSAYENVSRVAYAYARQLPLQHFCMVATRGSARKVMPPENVQVRDLATYATAAHPQNEEKSLLSAWNALTEKLRTNPELRVSIETRALEFYPQWLSNGLAVRNAWRELLNGEPVQAILCGDDSNPFTRLPVLLAAQRNIPTVDFHHGAMDGRYLLKDLSSDLYLAKSEMERDYLLRVCGLPEERVVTALPVPWKCVAGERETEHADSCVFFSEPYELDGMRAEQVYREVLPPLCRIARKNGRRVILKLHPFESRSQRGRLLRISVSREDRAIITIIDGPLTPELMKRAWFGMTVESTVVLDCQQNGVCCFLCRWLEYGSYGYGEQYVRFGIGENLESADQIERIPTRLQTWRTSAHVSSPVDPEILEHYLTAGRFPELRSAG